MEALNAVGLAPISVLSKQRTRPWKSPSIPTSSLLKSSNCTIFSTTQPCISECASRDFRSGLVFLSSILSTGLAKALTYEEALQQSVTSPPSSVTFDFDFGGFIDGIINFGAENPAVIASGAAILVVPLVLSQILKQPKPWGVESAKSAYAKLADDASAQLLDIRPPVEFREVGSPDIRGLKKKPVSIVYKGEDKPGFLKKLALKFKEPENTTLLILDKFGGNSELVAELVTVNGFKAAYAIKDGVEGPRGWMSSGLPWLLPKKILSLDLSNLTDALSGAVGEGSEAVSLTLGLAAAAGLGLLAFSEIETILQVLGSAALVQFVSNKLLFAEDRKQTVQEVSEFLDTKVAPKEFVDEIKQIGKALLSLPVSSKALPAPAEVTPAPSSTDSTVQKVEATPEPKAETTVEPTPQINSVPKPEVKGESLPGFPRPLSPYPYYPDYKPPTSPSPSQP